MTGFDGCKIVSRKGQIFDVKLYDRTEREVNDFKLTCVAKVERKVKVDFPFRIKSTRKLRNAEIISISIFIGVVVSAALFLLWRRFYKKVLSSFLLE